MVTLCKAVINEGLFNAYVCWLRAVCYRYQAPRIASPIYLKPRNSGADPCEHIWPFIDGEPVPKTEIALAIENEEIRMRDLEESS